jgi:hypothetical protein
MHETTKLHDEAMLLAEQADGARRAGDHAAAKRLFQLSLEKDRTAAESELTQPSRCILFRSAAWLALEAEDPAEAERMAAKGLSDVGTPERVKNELRQVAEEARLRLHMPLPPPSAVASLTLHMEGPAVGFGGAETSEIVPRIEAMQAAVTRTAERQAGSPFRRKGQATPALRQQLQPRMQVAAGSVIVQLTLGGGHPALWDRNEQVIAETRRCFEAYAKEGVAGLVTLIPDDTYRENFAALVARLAPDGKRVTSVDLVGATAKGPLPVVMLRGRTPSVDRKATGKTADRREIVGELRAADGLAKETKIGLVCDDGKVEKIIVSDAVLNDVVRPYYGERVRVTVQAKSRGRWALVGLPEMAE